MLRQQLDRALTAGFTVLWFYCSAAQAAPALFEELSAGAANARVAASPPKAAAVAAGCWSSFRLNADALRSSELELALPCGGTLQARTVAGGDSQRVARRSYGAGAGTNAWVGTVDGQPYGLVALTTGPKGILSGSIMLQGETHSIEHQQGDVYSLYKVDERALPKTHPEPPRPPSRGLLGSEARHADRTSLAAAAAVAAQPVEVPLPTAAPTAGGQKHLNLAARLAAAASSAVSAISFSAAATPAAGKAVGDPPGEVDVGIFYTHNAGAAFGEPLLKANIRAAVVAANAIYAASGLHINLNLAYLGMAPDYDLDAHGHNMAETLTAFADPFDGNMDAMWQVRLRYGIDAMVLVSSDYTYCGLAYIMEDPSFVWPFSVVSAACLPITLAHELGHNFGMQHDHDQQTAGTPFKPSSYGYRVPGLFSTIMAYPCAAFANCANCAPCPRIPFFSNPALSPTDAARIGVSDWADATATMNDPRAQYMMANWGVRRSPGRPAKPGRVRISVTSAGLFRVDWAPDPKNAADGFILYRRLGQMGVARVAANTRDGSVKHHVASKRAGVGVRHCYWVVAYNVVARSTSSATVCATGQDWQRQRSRGLLGTAVHANATALP